MSSWSVPEVTTRTGASHARRGVVCQDASGKHSLKDRSGQPVQLMVVADGHGGKRYNHSDVGSRLACELSLNLVAQQLGQWSSVGRGAAERWQEWLEVSFPKVLHQSWLAAVETHWLQKGTQTDADEDTFSPLAYGTTIALVVMTRTWWAHTGLGDWDLVRIGSGGEAELVNEEQEEDQTGGEATYSLCLTNAPRHFAARTAVHLITEQHSAFSLVLSTDGVRKSCSTDTDFFAIARYLCEAEQPRQGDAATQLNADLDRISSQGSGDDVSVAIGRWVLLRDKPHRPGGARRRHRRLQSSQTVIVQPRQEHTLPRTTTARPEANSQTDPGGDPNWELASKEAKAADEWWKRRVPWPVVGLVIFATGAFGVTAGMAWLGLGPFTRADSGSAPPSRELVGALVQQAEMLCNLTSRTRQNRDGSANTTILDTGDRNDMRDIQNSNTFGDSIQKNHDPAPLVHGDQNSGHMPDFIDPPSPYSQIGLSNDELRESISIFLKNYSTTFNELARGIKTPDSFLNAPSQYPLGALIAWNFRHPNLEPLEVSLVKQGGFQRRFEFCPELREALRQQWKKVDSLMPSRK